MERLVLRRPQRLARRRDRRLGHVPRRRRAPRRRGRASACASCSAAPGARASTSSRRTTPAATTPAPRSRTSRCALFRNRPEYRFEGRIHEQKTHNMPTLPARALRDHRRSGARTTATSRAGSAPPRTSPAATSSCSSSRRDESPADSVQRLQPRLRVPAAGRARARPREHFDDAPGQLMRGEPDLAAVRLRPDARRPRSCSARRIAGDLAGARRSPTQGLARSRPTPTSSSSRRWAPREAGQTRRARPRSSSAASQLGDAPARYSATVGSRHATSPLPARRDLRRERGRRRRGGGAATCRSLTEYPTFVGARAPLASRCSRRGAEPRGVAARCGAPTQPSAMLLLATALLRGRPRRRGRALVPRRARAPAGNAVRPDRRSPRRCSRSAATTRPPPRPRSSPPTRRSPTPPRSHRALRPRRRRRRRRRCGAAPRGPPTGSPPAELAVLRRLGRRARRPATAAAARAAAGARRAHRARGAAPRAGVRRLRARSSPVYRAHRAARGRQPPTRSPRSTSAAASSSRPPTSGWPSATRQAPEAARPRRARPGRLRAASCPTTRSSWPPARSSSIRRNAVAPGCSRSWASAEGPPHGGLQSAGHPKRVPRRKPVLKFFRGPAD